jgi:CheY-like chemotaxis protein
MNTDADRILIVEDDPRWQSVIQNGLSGLSQEILVAKTYEESLEHIKQTKIDLVVIDFGLPATSDSVSEIPGMDLLREIRRNEWNQNCAVVVVTGLATPERVTKALHEFDAYIVLEKSDFPVPSVLANIARYAILKARKPAPVSEKPSSFIAFLCHAIEDKAKVKELYHRLRRTGIQSWLDEENLLPGQHWEKEIRKAIQEASVILVFLSESSVTKEGFVNKEIKIALDVADEKPENAIFIIPVKLQDCQIPERLSHIQHVSLQDERGYDRLLQTLKICAGIR